MLSDDNENKLKNEKQQIVLCLCFMSIEVTSALYLCYLSSYFSGKLTLDSALSLTCTQTAPADVREHDNISRLRYNSV